MKDPGEHPDEEMPRTRYWERAGSFHASLGTTLSITSMCSPAYKLCELDTSGIFREAASWVSKYDVSLKPLLVPIPLKEAGHGEAEIFKLFPLGPSPIYPAWDG